MNNNKLVVSCGQAHELEMAFARCGWTNVDIKSLTDEMKLEQFLAVLKGTSEIEPVRQLIINTEERPKGMPGFECWKTEKHLGIGLLRFSTEGVELYSSTEGKWKKGCFATFWAERQEHRNFEVTTDKLLEEIAKKSDEHLQLNSVVLDFLLAHTEFIPEYWKDFYVGFTGTIYKFTNHAGEGSAMDKYRVLYWDGKKWGEGTGGTREQLKKNTPAGVFAIKQC